VVTADIQAGIERHIEEQASLAGGHFVVPEKVGFGRMGVFDGANLGRRGSA